MTTDSWNEGLPHRLKEENWFLPAGALIIGGGGECPAFDEALVKYAGGKDAPLVVVPTADGTATRGSFSPGLGGYKEQGWTNIQVLHKCGAAGARDGYRHGLCGEPGNCHTGIG